MKDYRLKDKVFTFCIFKNTDSSYFKIREILKKGRIAGNENGIRLITPILECLRCVKKSDSWPVLNNELWGIGVRISTLERMGIQYTVLDCQNCANCKVLTIPVNTIIDLKDLGKHDVVVLCPTKKEQEKFYTYKKIGKKNWPCWHWLSLSCKYILDYSKDDEGLDKYLHHRFNMKNYKEDDICQPNNELF